MTNTTTSHKRIARQAHQHACLICQRRWDCRNRCASKVNRICWPCVKRGIERLTKEQAR